MTVEQWKTKAAHPPPVLTGLLQAAGIEPSIWLRAVEHFGQWFHRAAGHIEQVNSILARQQRKWVQGIQACRDVFT